VQTILLVLLFAYFSLLLLSACLYLLFAGPDARAKRQTAAAERYLAALADGKPIRYSKIKRLGNCDEAAASLVKGYTALRRRRPEQAAALLTRLCVTLAEKERRCAPSDVVGRLFYLRLLEELRPDPLRYAKRLEELPDCLLVSCERGTAAAKPASAARISRRARALLSKSL
jgi:hypothetical protein